MQQWLQAAQTSAANGDAFVLVTILERHGSSPRGLGACMYIGSDGFADTIGGGAVEFAAQNDGRALLTSGADGDSFQKSYILHPNEAADLGMVCGGMVETIFQYFAPTEANIALFTALAEAARTGGNACLIRRIEGGRVVESFCRAGGEEERKPTFEDGVLVQPVGVNGRVYIFGGGHVAQRLVPLLAYVGFRPTVVEDRADFADPALFPAAEETVLTEFGSYDARISITRADAVVVMTRGHQADFEVLRKALKTEAYYIGCIGSRHKVAVTRERLREEGYGEADFARVHSPIGLAIRAETPEEIAVSIVAEMILCRANANA